MLPWRLFSLIVVLVLISTLAACASPAGPTVVPTTSATATSAPPVTPTGAAPVTLSSLTGRIVFSAGAPHAEDIYFINANGTGLTRITTDPAADFDPTWSPDGKRVAYRHQPGDDLTTDIYVINVDGSGAANLTHSDGVADWGPAWSPDGNTIAWNSSRDKLPGGTLHGFLMSPDGSNVRRLTDQIWVEYPAWSPDGQKIAFMAQSPEGSEDYYDIYVVNADGTGLARLTDAPDADGWPAWSPDGKHILFASVRDDCRYSKAADCKTTGDIGPYHTLYVMNADGSGQTHLTDLFAQFADWSPDGRHIVFAPGSMPGGLYIMNADGSDVTQLPIGASIPEPGFPDWAP